MLTDNQLKAVALAFAFVCWQMNGRKKRKEDIFIMNPIQYSVNPNGFVHMYYSQWHFPMLKALRVENEKKTQTQIWLGLIRDRFYPLYLNYRLWQALSIQMNKTKQKE